MCKLSFSSSLLPPCPLSPRSGCCWPPWSSHRDWTGSAPWWTWSSAPAWSRWACCSRAPPGSPGTSPHCCSEMSKGFFLYFLCQYRKLLFVCFNWKIIKWISFCVYKQCKIGFYISIELFKAVLKIVHQNKYSPIFQFGKFYWLCFYAAGGALKNSGSSSSSWIRSRWLKSSVSYVNLAWKRMWIKMEEVFLKCAPPEQMSPLFIRKCFRNSIILDCLDH